MRDFIEISSAEGVADCLIFLDAIAAITDDSGHALVHLICGTKIHFHNQTYKKYTDSLKGAK